MASLCTRTTQIVRKSRRCKLPFTVGAAPVICEQISPCAGGGRWSLFHCRGLKVRKMKNLSWIYHGFIHQNYGFPMVFRCFPADLSSAMLGFHVGKWPDWRGKWENDWRRLEDSKSIQGIFSYLMFLQNKFREGKISEITGPLIQQICFTQYTWVCPKLGRLQNRHFNGKDSLGNPRFSPSMLTRGYISVSGL